MNRRQFISIFGGSLAVLGAVPHLSLAAKSDSIAALQSDWTAFLPTGLSPVVAEPQLKRSDREWRERLPADAYKVLFEEDTERPFSSQLNDEKRPGVFVCRACDLPLFTSGMKYDSGTGWPSFFTAIPNHLDTKTDYKLIWPRTEYHCVKCGGHQGHVFDDGPQPTRQRWCNNGVALRFIPRMA